MSTIIQPPPAWATLPVDLLLDIVARSDVTTVVRSAATSRILRAAILAPAFRRLVLQAAADGGGFDPSGLLLGVTYVRHDSDSKPTTHRVIHTPQPTRPRVHLDGGSIQECCEPVAARDGLFLLRRHEYAPLIRLRVCNTLTGLVTDIPPAAVSDTDPQIVLSVDGGSSFKLYVVGYRMRFQTFSSKDGGTWGVVHEPSAPQPHLRGPSRPVVVGRTVYWLFKQNVIESYDMILALDTDAAEATTMELPDGCLSRMLQCRNDRHLLLATVRGRLSLLVTESRGISMWTFTPASSGSGMAAAWSRRLVIGVTEMLRQAGLEDSYRLTCTPFNLEGLGERSGSLILSLGLGQLFRLDMKSKDAIVFRRLTRPGSVWVTHVFLHETDLISLLGTMKIF